MDWGIAHYIDERGRTHKTPAFVMILGNSRRKYIIKAINEGLL